MSNTYQVKESYRSSSSKLPEGQYDLTRNEFVDLICVNPRVMVRRYDGTYVPLIGPIGYLLQKS